MKYFMPGLLALSLIGCHVKVSAGADGITIEPARDRIPALLDTNLQTRTDGITRERIYIRDNRIQISVECVFDEQKWLTAVMEPISVPAIVTDTTFTILSSHMVTATSEHGSCSRSLNPGVYTVSQGGGYYRVRSADGSFDRLFLRVN